MSKAAEHQDRAAEYHNDLAWHAQEENTNYVPDCGQGFTLHSLRESAMDFVVMLVSLIAIAGLVLIDLWVLVKFWHFVFG